MKYERKARREKNSFLNELKEIYKRKITDEIKMKRTFKKKQKKKHKKLIVLFRSYCFRFFTIFCTNV